MAINKKKEGKNMGVLSNLEPKEVFAYFEDICAIPHASYQEKKISDYCVEFAKRHNLSYYQDELNNIIIKKDASEGYEEAPPVILQGHLDMVCEKEPGCDINFNVDGLELVVEGDYITANGTTLGGDDGIAIAYALAILASDTIKHPKIEVLFTASEEVGMDGASGIDASKLEARRLINLDSEEEGILLAGCAGGASVECTLPSHFIPASGIAIKITVNGLAGGHSGTEINKGRANANLMMGRVLVELSKNIQYSLAQCEGGKKENAIPRECSVILCIAEDKLSQTVQAVSKLQQEFANEYALTDPGVQCKVEQNAQLPSHMLDEESTKAIVMLVNALPNGVQAMSADVDGLVETSLNLGIMKLTQEQFSLRYAVRSSVSSSLNALLDKLSYLTNGFGGKARISGIYPAWEYKRDSMLRDKMIAVYESMYGKKPAVEAIHAGLECGILAGKLPGLDCISLGPDMQAVHTTEEKLSISSTKRVWDYLLAVLQDLKA